MEDVLLKFRYPLLMLLGGLVVVCLGFFFIKSGLNSPSTKVEVLSGNTENPAEEITVEISGEVERPGVYKLSAGSRVEDLLIVSGGFSADADRVWTDKYLNRAAKITDGQKLYIPKEGATGLMSGERSGSSSAKNGSGDQTISPSFSSDSNNLININTASLNQLDSLPGIGPVYGQSIIEHRPYSTVSELLSKGALKSSVYQKVKDLVAVY